MVRPSKSLKKLDFTFRHSEIISMDWSQIMVRTLQEGSIRELHLYQVPVLKNVETGTR
jgi:hypothetical protein